MDNMGNFTEKVEKLRNQMKNLPPEQQLRVLWIMFSTLAHKIEELNAYQEAEVEALVKYAEKCGKVEEKTQLKKIVLMTQLTEAIVEFDKDLEERK